MNVNNFYSKRGPTFTRHLRYIVSRDLPDDGNASDRGGDDDDSEDETENDFEAQCSSSGEESTSEENDSSNVVSTAHVPEITSVSRKNSDGSVTQVRCPNLITEYNSNMGGVDLLDQLKSYYCYNRKSKRWWIRLFYHLIDLCVVNSYILYRRCYNINVHPPMVYKPLSQLQFRLKLIDKLVNHFTCRKQTGPVVTPIVSLIPSGHKVQDLRPFGICKGRCEFCSIGQHRKPNKRKETMFGCSKCMKRLCPVGCWTDFHSKHLPQQ